MPKMDSSKLKFECHNPKCKQMVEVRHQEIWSGSREVKCNRCRTKHRFDSTLASRARMSADELERSQQKFDRAFGELLGQKIEVTVG